MKTSRLLLHFNVIGLLVAGCTSVRVIADTVVAPIPNISQTASKTSIILLFDDESLFSNQPYQKEIQNIQSLRRAKDMNGLLRLADNIEKTWGQQSDTRGYFALMDEVTNVLVSEDFGFVNLYQQDNLTQKYVLMTLAHGNVPLDMTARLLPRLLPEENLMLTKRPFDTSRWAQLRTTSTPLWLQTRKRLAEAVIPNYDFTSPLYINSVGDLEELKDPQRAAAREQAFQETNRQAKKRTDQIVLRNIEKSFLPLAEEEVVSLYSHVPYDTPELRHFLDNYMEDAATKQRILDQVAKNIAAASQKP